MFEGALLLAYSCDPMSTTYSGCGRRRCSTSCQMFVQTAATWAICGPMLLEQTSTASGRIHVSTTHERWAVSLGGSSGCTSHQCSALSMFSGTGVPHPSPHGDDRLRLLYRRAWRRGGKLIRGKGQHSFPCCDEACSAALLQFPANFLAGAEGIPSWSRSMQDLQDVFALVGNK